MWCPIPEVCKRKILNSFLILQCVWYSTAITQGKTRENFLYLVLCCWYSTVYLNKKQMSVSVHRFLCWMLKWLK